MIIISTIILAEVIFLEAAHSANKTEIIIDENLRPGMSLKEAFELLGPPEKIDVSDAGTIIIPYDSLGLSIEILNGGAVIDKIHTNSSFKGRFASEIENSKIPNSEPVKNMEVTASPEEVQEKVQEEVREEVREEVKEELREEVKRELREEVLEEVNKEVAEDFDVFDLYGFKVKML